LDLLETTKSIGIEGFLHPSEMDKLAELAANRDVLEIGSFKGLSAFCMAITAKSLMCCDTFSANSAGQEQMESVQTLDDFRTATARFLNVEYRLYSSETAAVCLTDDYDMIFLDAMHTYEDVVADIARWWPRVRPCGVIVFHDYGHDHFQGVKRAVDEVFGPAPEGTTVVTLRWVHK